MPLAWIKMLIEKNDPTERNHQNREIPQNNEGPRFDSKEMNEERSQKQGVNQAAADKCEVFERLLMEKRSPVFTERMNQNYLRTNITRHFTCKPSEIPDGRKKEAGDVYAEAHGQ
jgi:hypothetical protein